MAEIILNEDGDSSGEITMSVAEAHLLSEDNVIIRCPMCSTSERTVYHPTARYQYVTLRLNAMRKAPPHESWQ